MNKLHGRIRNEEIFVYICCAVYFAENSQYVELLNVKG